MAIDIVKRSVFNAGDELIERNGGFEESLATADAVATSRPHGYAPSLYLLTFAINTITAARQGLLPETVERRIVTEIGAVDEDASRRRARALLAYLVDVE